jgi:hypothetical protein
MTVPRLTAVVLLFHLRYCRRVRFNGRSLTLAQQSRLELGCVSGIDSKGRTIWIADAHRSGGKPFVVHADEKLTALLNWNQ